MAVNDKRIRDDLRRKVPRITLMFVDQHVFWTIFGLGLAVFALHGPVAGRTDYNGLRYVLGSCLCPVIAAACHLQWPYNPYHGTWARLASMTDNDKSDPESERLVELLRSVEARRFLVRTAAQIASVLFLAMGVLAIFHWQSLSWTWLSPWLGQGLILGSFGAWAALKTQYLKWGIERWAATVDAERSDLRLQ